MRWTRLRKPPNIVNVRTRYDDSNGKHYVELRLLVGSSAKVSFVSQLKDDKFGYTVPPASSAESWPGEGTELTNGLTFGDTAKAQECPMTEDKNVTCTVAHHAWDIAVTIDAYYGSPRGSTAEIVDFKCMKCP